MIFEQGYEYYTDNIAESFLGDLRIKGWFVQDSPTEYHGWLHVLGKKRPVIDAGIVNGDYRYAIRAIGLKIVIEAHLSESHSLDGFGYTKGKAPMKFYGGAYKRVRISDGKEEDVGTWQSKYDFAGKE